MNKIIELERNKVDNLYRLLEELVLNLEFAKDMDNSSKLNLMTKLRLLNKSIGYLENDIVDILDDLKIGGCNLSKDLEERIQEENQTNQLIKEVSPLLLYYLINRNQE